MTKTYKEMLQFPTFEERLRYLMTKQAVGDSVWSWRRHLNQQFYSSPEWQRARRDVIVRDNGCDLAVPGYQLQRGLLVHHINPITYEDILNRAPCVFDLDNLVLTSGTTHQLIHYMTENNMPAIDAVRKPGDTKLW